MIAQLVKNLAAIQENSVLFLVGKFCWRRDRLPTPIFLGFPCGSVGKEFTCNVGDLGSIPGLGGSAGEGKGYPLQYSELENSVDKESGMTERLSLHFILREAKIEFPNQCCAYKIWIARVMKYLQLLITSCVRKKHHLTRRLNINR